MSITPEQRARYADPSKKRCDCGKPAVKKTEDGFACERCLRVQAEFERQMVREFRVALTRSSRVNQERERTGARKQSFWNRAGLFADFAKPADQIGFGSLETLEQKLKTA